MKVKTKKQNFDGVVRLETSGNLKEIIINEDFMHSDEASIALCFRGKESSGIIELNKKEIEILSKELSKRAHLLSGIKVMKFQK